MTNHGIETPPQRIAQMCRRHAIRKLALLGSIHRDDFGTDSEVDVLVEFASAKTPALEFFAIQDELSKILGREADRHTPALLSR